MLSSVRKVIEQSIAAYKVSPRTHWVINWPGQVVICVSSIFWTAEVPEVMPIENGVAVSLYCVGTVGVDGWEVDGWEVDGWEVDGWKRGGWEVDGWERGGWEVDGWEVDGWEVDGWEVDGCKEGR